MKWAFLTARNAGRSFLSKNDLVAGLDIGTTKTCCVVAETAEGGDLIISGVGISPSTGLKRGIVVDYLSLFNEPEQVYTKIKYPEVKVLLRDHVGPALMQSGDTLFRIALKYQVTVAQLRDANPQVGGDIIQPGDVLIHGGFPGHAVIVIDVAINKDGRKIYLLAQSYMPAQDIHVLKNYVNPDISPWYKVNDETEIKTPEYTFTKYELKRW